MLRTITLCSPFAYYGARLHTCCALHKLQPSDRPQQSSSVDKQALSQLRKRTGYPFNRCRQALVKFENDVKAADEWLRQEAVKQGWAKAGRLGARPMSQGLIGLMYKEGSASLVEVNCETDFVARNMDFQRLVASVAETCWHLTKAGGEGQRLDWSKGDLEALPSHADPSKRLADLVAMQIGIVGENMAMRRALGFTAASGESLAFYSHAPWQDAAKRMEDCHFGKYAALLRLRQLDPSVTFDQRIGQQLCQHIVGMNPRGVGRVDVDRANENPDEEELFVFQNFLLDESLTVGQVLERSGLEVVGEFVRYECGEKLPGEDS